MATVGHYQDGLEGLRSGIRATVETAFYGNNVRPVASARDAYLLAKNSPGSVELTGMPMCETESLGLPQGANVLLFNIGAVVGRCVAARKIIGEPGVDVDEYSKKLRKAIYGTCYRKLYHV